MATSSNPSMSHQTPMVQMISHSSLKVAQAASMIAPPAYIISSLILRRGKTPFSIRGLMRTSLNSVVVGAGIGGLAGWARLRSEPIEAIEDRCYRMANNPSQIETDDYSIIGATLSALLVPAVFLRRAPLPHLILGGASIGLGAGVWFHLGRMFSEGNKVRPEGMVGEIPVVGGNPK